MNTNELLTETLNNLEQYKHQVARVFHGRGHAFQGFEAINIEWYPPVLFVQCYEEQLPIELKAVLQTIAEQFTPINSILVQTRPWPKVESELIFQRSNEAIELPLEFHAPLTDSLNCLISLGKNRNTGVFPDMRSGWDWISENAKGKRILNLFSYTGIFSLIALEAGAEKVVNIDMCGGAIKTSQRNHQLNDFNDGRTSFWKRNILKSNAQIAKQSNFDIIILDPPPFQKGSFNGWGDYQKLLRRCSNYLKDTGTILACLNNQQVDLEEFKTGIKETLPNTTEMRRIDLSPEIKEADPAKGLKLVLIHVDSNDGSQA